MPTLDWIGKKVVVNHHNEVPFHLLKERPDLSVGEPGSGNLLVEGDNLLALKALLPYYAGQVKCIYIDPPYNTGNEGWVYNDNVSSPEIRKWLGKVVGSEMEDLSRHDKWLCMMYPRLCLLREMLREDGAIFVSLDDNEISELRFLLDEIFGTRSFVAHIIWEKRKSRENRRAFSFKHDFILAYARNKEKFDTSLNLLPVSKEVLARYKNPDNDSRGPWQSISANAQAGHATPAQFYKLMTPSGKLIEPPPGRCWLYTKERMEEEIRAGSIWFGKSGNNVPRIKKFLASAETRGLTPETIWYANDVGTNDEAKKNLIDIFGAKDVFDSPKPVSLIEQVIRLTAKPGDIILDSFAGSGTTGHAVAQLNKQDGGNRRFILVEMESNICRNVTAERLRRVCNGYENSEGNRVEGLGGGFRYCKLGTACFDEYGRINTEVTFVDLARHVFFSETGEPLPKQAEVDNPLIGTYKDTAVYLLYNGILKDKQLEGGNVLTQAVLNRLPKHNGPKVIYGTACRFSPARLKRENIVFKQIPYEIRVR